MSWRTFAPVAIAAALLGGCASTSAREPFKNVATEVRARSGHDIRWNQGTDDDKKADDAVDALLRRELTVDGAVQVALLANASLQATFEELAISQADLVQAGLLKNPTFAIGMTAWEAEHISPNLFASVEQDFLDIVTMPMRKRVAATELEATKLAVGDHVLELAAQVREAFYNAMAAEQVSAMRRLVDDASQTAAELARRQHEAGNMSDLALSTQLSLPAQTALDRRRAEGEAAVAREKLNKLMGVWGPRTAWKMAARLPELPKEEASLENLESKAIEQRLDIGAARRNVQAMDYALGLAKTTRWFGSVNVSLEAARLRSTGHFSFGPSVALEIPLFDQRQAQIAKLEAFKRQGESSLRALAVDVRADVRATSARVVTARSVVEQYAKSVVPLREQVVRFSQEQYDAMLLGVYQLIQAKQDEFDAYREYIEALRDYWVARSDLERAVGGRVGAPAPAVANHPAAVVAPPPAHSH
ncbi:Copper tolerance protein [Labilithrix luteola]|uniref:Copper tolerance protein n=1 Tax=Labilithrix luteola TaxID=1391654 RepID=A0A0K1PN42_9BACT|nr:TolC family protein [Labilithrix luteola]AKU94948.1 Copper tolerance protein [Labilithrix luteola]